MTEKRIVTIGVNINLGNYENLRLEVTDTAEDEADVRNLAEFLGHALDGFGMNNATTKAAIDKYKERVLDTHAPEEEDWSEYKAVTNSIHEPQENGDAPEKKETGGEDTGKAEEEEIIEEETAGDEEAEEVKEEEELAEVETEADKETEKETEKKKTAEKTWIPAPIPAKPPTPRPQTVKPAPSPDGEYICEKCGAPISKVQRDVSNLFMGKTLCKNCMK